ncbi:MAG: dehypoxanthine futalosine cyclase [Armatimonadetes bacterium]|nr:dehypoxanthine futalosine cyclase [Armatimonadota bacterium]
MGELQPRSGSLGDALARAANGGRLTADECLAAAQSADLLQLAAAADAVRRRLNPAQVVTYVVGRNVNYTNVCWVRCKFCAFYRVPGSDAGYVLPLEAILQKIEEMVDAGGAEVLLQGGLNPSLKIDWFEELFRTVKRRFAGKTVTLHALSPAEAIYIARISRLTLSETLGRLRASGLDSMPGGGAEILTDRVRHAISPYKDTADEWIDCMRVAHGLGIRTTATMMYGSIDTWEDRVEHLMRLRDLQDETGGFTAFIPWSFQPDGTELGGSRASAVDYLRTVAVSRLALDNVPHLQASWVTQGPRVAQIALGYGLDDFGSTMMEENVVSAAGCRFTMPIEELERQIRAAGYEPIRRTTQYEPIFGPKA